MPYGLVIHDKFTQDLIHKFQTNMDRVKVELKEEMEEETNKFGNQCFADKSCVEEDPLAK